MTLEEYLKDKVLPPFTAHILDDRLELRFDTIAANAKVAAINLRNEMEYAVFRNLLGNRKIRIVGNEVGLNAEYIILHIDTWPEHRPIPEIEWINF